MMNETELHAYLHHAAKHPDELTWKGKIKGTVLPSDTMFRPGEMVAIHVHPTNEGPPLPFDGEIGPHQHEFIEIPYVYEGRCEMNVEGKLFTLSEGDFVILDTNSAHLPKVEDGCILVNLVIEPKFFNDVFFGQFTPNDPLAGFFASIIYSQKSAKRYLKFETGNDPRVRQLFIMIMQEYYSGEVCSDHIVENFTMVLFSTMVRLQQQKTATVTAGESMEQSVLTEILNYMNAHLSDVSREDLAAHFGYSYSYITTILRSATGMTFSKLKNTLRLQRAEQLLRTTDRPIMEISHDAGFSNVTNFYEQFRSTYGVTPQDFRMKLRQNR